MFGTLTASGAAVADHNSKNAEGWANMPNDIHNMRTETRSRIHRDTSMTSQSRRSAAGNRSGGSKCGGGKR
jgi:hypothetical protein